MPYKDLSTQYPSMKGISVQLPFVTFKYIKVDAVQSESTSNYSKVQTATTPGNTRPAVLSRMIPVEAAETTSLGVDTMISHASVIHELTFGRIGPARDHRPPAAYPAVSDPPPHSLDIIV